MQDLEINSRIRQLITDKGYTIYQLSKESSIPLSTLYGIINNVYLPSIHTLIIICKFLNVSMGEFFLECCSAGSFYLSPSEEQHIFLYRSISSRLQNHIDEYLLLLAETNASKHE
ncbi:MAG: helix-turn-helix transcriptional regulator [Lachnospiraceae bacterium]|nr:helix-turn-helix transcriptional regulator [Lachnospiraceae bacterium]